MADPVLKPCPFCGGHDIAPSSRNNGEFNLLFLVCKGCEAEGPCSVLGGTARAIENWNRRADPSGTLREALTNLVLAVEAGKPDAITKALSHASAALGETGGTDG